MASLTRIERIIARIRAIPEGFVQTYGDIDPSAPRLVGHVLATLPDPGATVPDPGATLPDPGGALPDPDEQSGLGDLPWHRVVRADGRAPVGARQLALLRREGGPIRGDRVEMRRARLPREHLDPP